MNSPRLTSECRYESVHQTVYQGYSFAEVCERGGASGQSIYKWVRTPWAGTCERRADEQRSKGQDIHALLGNPALSLPVGLDPRFSGL